MEEIVSLIRDVGFPIAVCVYLIWNQTTTMNKWTELMATFEKTISDNTTALDGIKSLIASLHNKDGE